MAKDLDGPTVIQLTVAASGGTDAGTFKVEVDTDAEVEELWPWPETWPVTSE